MESQSPPADAPEPGPAAAPKKEKKKELEDSERKLEEYRRRNSGELPTQVGANQQTLQNLQTQIQAAEWLRKAFNRCNA